MNPIRILTRIIKSHLLSTKKQCQYKRNAFFDWLFLLKRKLHKNKDLKTQHLSLVTTTSGDKIKTNVDYFKVESFFIMVAESSIILEKFITKPLC
jgi:hypothetical protein